MGSMTVGGLVRETIALQRAYTCEHEWKPLNTGEDQCQRCTIIATPEGKESLARISANYRRKHR